MRNRYNSVQKGLETRMLTFCTSLFSLPFCFGLPAKARAAICGDGARGPRHPQLARLSVQRAVASILQVPGSPSLLIATQRATHSMIGSTARTATAFGYGHGTACPY